MRMMKMGKMKKMGRYDNTGPSRMMEKMYKAGRK